MQVVDYKVDMLERLYFLIKNIQWMNGWQSNNYVVDYWIRVGDFTALIKSLRFEIKYEKVSKGDEVITIEKEDGLYKIMFRKQSRDKSVKKLNSRSTFKKGRRNRENNKTKNQTAISDSPFFSLNVLLKN